MHEEYARAWSNPCRKRQNDNIDNDENLEIYIDAFSIKLNIGGSKSIYKRYALCFLTPMAKIIR
jgi:hypothetical protein